MTADETQPITNWMRGYAAALETVTAGDSTALADRRREQAEGIRRLFGHGAFEAETKSEAAS